MPSHISSNKIISHKLPQTVPATREQIYAPMWTLLFKPPHNFIKNNLNLYFSYFLWMLNILTFKNTKSMKYLYSSTSASSDYLKMSVSCFFNPDHFFLLSLQNPCKKVQKTHLILSDKHLHWGFLKLHLDKSHTPKPIHLWVP